MVEVKIEAHLPRDGMLSINETVEVHQSSSDEINNSEDVSIDGRTVGTQVAIKEHNNRANYHFGKITSRYINPLMSCNPEFYRTTRTGRQLRLSESERSNLKLKENDIIFYHWYDNRGKYVYPPLNVTANFKGLIKSVPKDKTSNSLWKVLTPAAYTFPHLSARP